MSWEIDPEESRENKPTEDIKNYNKRLVDSLFSDSYSKSPRIFINDYILKLLEISREPMSPREFARSKSISKPLSRDILCGIIDRYLRELGWTCGLDIPSENPLSSHRFDVVAQKDWYTIIIEVRPEINIACFDEILSHIECARSNFSRVRFFLGTDFSNLRHLLIGDDITDILTEFAMRYQLGIIFANQDEFWLVPAEFLLINTGF